MRRLVIAVIGLLVLVAGASSQAQASASSGSGAGIKIHGTVHAELVPASVMRPAYAYGCSENVCMELNGTGLSATPWNIWGYYLAPGQCAYSAYWVPSTHPALFGPELCNTTGGPVSYHSYADITVSGPGQVCSTVVGLAGKPCEYMS